MYEGPFNKLKGGDELPYSKDKVPEDSRIVELYFARDEKAITETDLKYRNYLFSVAHSIVNDREDCRECLNDTYLAAWNAIPPAKPTVLKAFLTVIMRRVATNRYYRKIRKGQVPSEMTHSLSEFADMLADDEGVESVLDTTVLAGVISEFARQLPVRRQYIFMARYYMCMPIDKIASDLSVSRSTVQKELSAIRSALKEKLESEGYLQ